LRKAPHIGLSGALAVWRRSAACQTPSDARSITITTS
jgi:hypothetical protein